MSSEKIYFQKCLRKFLKGSLFYLVFLLALASACIFACLVQVNEWFILLFIPFLAGLNYVLDVLVQKGWM